MNDNQLVGAIVLYVNGREFDCGSISPKIMTGRKPVPSMNKEGRVRKKTKTIKSIGLSLEVFVDEVDDFDWERVSMVANAPPISTVVSLMCQRAIKPMVRQPAALKCLH